jgi:hypothetical protein
MARRKLYLPALIVAAAVLMACVAALLAVSEKAEATFPGKNGKIAYTGTGATDDEIYTIKAGGGVESNSPATLQTTGSLPTRPAARR